MAWGPSRARIRRSGERRPARAKHARRAVTHGRRRDVNVVGVEGAKIRAGDVPCGARPATARTTWTRNGVGCRRRHRRERRQQDAGAHKQQALPPFDSQEVRVPVVDARRLLARRNRRVPAAEQRLRAAHDDCWWPASRRRPTDRGSPPIAGGRTGCARRTESQHPSAECEIDQRRVRLSFSSASLE